MITTPEASRLARELLACGTHDPARKHPDGSPAKGRWTVITAPTELVEALRAALVSQPDEARDAGWQPMDTAPKVIGRILGSVEGRARSICWGKASHVPMYGWILTDQGPEDADLCEPDGWMELPAAMSKEQPCPRSSHDRRPDIA